MGSHLSTFGWSGPAEKLPCARRGWRLTKSSITRPPAQIGLRPDTFARKPQFADRQRLGHCANRRMTFFTPSTVRSGHSHPLKSPYCDLSETPTWPQSASRTPTASPRPLFSFFRLCRVASGLYSPHTQLLVLSVKLIAQCRGLACTQWPHYSSSACSPKTTSCAPIPRAGPYCRPRTRTS